jgi:hypothetical protein
MELSASSRQIEQILSCREQVGQQVEMLLDRYECLNSDDARAAFVASLIQRLVLERARRPRSAEKSRIASNPTNP